MKRLVVGVLAHVDSGKTTLSEAMLYRAGALRRLGRVDHKDAFLDTDALEKARGITIFAKQAVLELPGAVLTLLDTPGHVDFSAEAERTLQVLDYAVLVISGTDGVQSHTETLWRLLQKYRVPTFIFVNKCDLPGADRAVRLRELQGRFGDGCVDFSAQSPDPEALALCSEPLMEETLADGAPEPGTIVTAIARRQVFPVYFGAALRLDGVDALLEGLQRWTRQPRAGEEFGARVFKISQDEQGARLTHLKITGGVLRVKDPLCDGEKADQLRLYSGARYRLVSESEPGTVVAVTGPTHTRPGQGLGAAADGGAPLLEPVLNYKVLLPEGADPHAALRALRTLEEEDPQLHVVWQAALGEIHVQLMGEVQLEILQSLLKTRFGLSAGFGEGGILYKESITEPVAGVGHYEPLRHYAEVHLRLEPAPRGSGVQPAGYAPCHNAEEVLAAAGYDADADTENPADSVFCSHGAGYLVHWDEVPAKAHLAVRDPSAPQSEEEEQPDARRCRAAAYRGTLAEDKELLEIFERTYGKIKRRDDKSLHQALHTRPERPVQQTPSKALTGPEYLLVDGYNVIFAWEELNRIAQENLDGARRRLMDILCNYAGYRRCVPILVFDAYRVKGGSREVEQYHNLHIVYTREAETADMFIERATHQLAKDHRTRVVSSDGAEQLIILGNGALRVSARAFAAEVAAVEAEIREFLEE